MFCVNVKSKEFKEACNRLNIHPSSLEVIVFQYLNNIDAESFPSDEYIMSKLEGKAMTDASESQISLWEKAYSTPKIFSDRASVGAFIKEASKYFSPDSISIYRNNEGQYVAKVTKPENNVDTSSTESDDIMYSYNPSSGGMTSFSTRERVKNHYLRTVSTSVERSIQTIEALQKVFSNIRISTADSNMSDANGFSAMEDAQKLAAQARLKYGNLAEVRVVEKRGYIELQITPKSKEELEKFYTNRVYEYIRNLSNEDILNELLTIESNYYDDLAYHIKAKDIPVVKEQIAKKNANITAQEIEEAIDFLVSLENNPETNLYVNTCIKWLKNGVIRLPQDNDAILAIFKMAREEGFDVQKLKHPFDVIRLKIEKNKKSIIPGKATNPREIPQFSYSRSIETEEGIIEVYDVEDSYEGQAAVCQALADASPKGEDGSWILGDFSSPWCLSTFNYDKNTGKATPTHGAVHTFWPRYDKGKRQIAFHNGMPVGFNSTDKIGYEDEWWDYWDSPKTYLDTSNITSRNRINNEIQPISESLMNTNLGFANVYINESGEVYNISYNQGNYSFFFGHNEGHLTNIRVPFSIFSPSSSFNYHVSIFNSTGEIEIMYKRKRIHIAIPQSRIEEIRKLSKLLMSKHEEFKEIKKTLENKCKPFAERLLPMPSELLNEIMTFSEEAQGEIDDIVKKLKKESEIILNDVENYIIEEERKKEEARIVSPDIAEAVLESLEDLEEGYIEPREPMYVEPENRDTRVTPEEYTTHTEEMDPIEENILNSTTEKINKKSKYRRFTPKILQRILQSIKDIDYKSSYNRHYQETVNQDLEVKLKDILEHYHFEVLETSMREVFGDDILGATDFLNKVIYLAERGDRNAITGVEEFAHAFVKMMGSIYHKPENRERFPETKIYSEIRDEIGNTSLYQQVLERYSSDPQYQHEDGSPNLPKIKEEAIGQALATVLLDRYEAKNRKDKAFFDKIKQWFRDILTKFKAIFVNSAYLDKQLMSIADSILDGTYHKKFLQKVNDGNYKLQNYTETIENSVTEDEGLSLSIMQDAVACGGIITGSLSYRMQTPVYRDSADALHDIDIAFPLSRHLWHARHPFFRNPRTVRTDRMMYMDRILQEVETFDPIARFKERQPNTTLMYAYWGDKDILVVNAIISENEELKERFKNLTGNFNSRLEHFTEEERKQIRLVDFFFNPDNKIEEDVINDEVFNLKLANYKHSFRAKLKYGRAKDIYDYQTLNPVNRQYLIDRADVAERQLMWQKKPSTNTSASTSWARTSENNYEVSTAGDRRFSAMVAKFNPGTIIEGVDVGGMTIEQVYQSVIKKSRKGQPPAEDSMINRPVTESQLSEEARKDFYSINKEDWSYRVGYLPLWQEWAKQNPQLIEELRENSAGKTLTDKFANTRVSQARALAEILNSTESNSNPETEENSTETVSKTTEEQFMENQQALIREIENLNELGLSQSEVRHLGEQLMWWISDHLTVLQTTPEELERVYGIGEDQLKGRDVTKLSRKEIAELVTPDRLMFQCMRAFTGRSGMTPRQALKIKKIANNFKALMFLSSSTFSDIEGFGLIEPGADFGIMSEIKFTPEDFNNSDDIDTIMENEGDIQQHWQVNFRTLDVLDHMTSEVRLELLKCYQLDKKGNPIISEYGIKERINARQAVNTILRICQGRNDLPSMIKKMRENVNTYPWLQQIITRLEDESRQNDNFKSAFFTTFCKPFVSYSVTRKNKDGVYESIIVNEFPALREAVNSVTTKYKMNQHPMFNNEGITDDFREVKKIYESLKEAKFEELDLEELKNKLTYVYNALGYDITPDFIEPLLDEKTVKDIVTNLGYVVNSVEQGFFKLGSTYDPFKFRGDYNILTSVRNILRKVSEQLEDTSVASTYDSGKMYQSYVTQSYLSKLMSKFKFDESNKEEVAAFEEFIKEEYGNYEWFTNSDGTFRNSWLELLATDSKYRSIFKHKVQLNFNKKNYMRNMSKSEYVMSMITEYFSELDKDNNFSVAWYRVPMMSNKPSSEFIRFVSYNNVDYKSQITKKLFNVFLQEISRIQTVEMRGLSKGDPKYIKNFDSNGKKFCFLDYFNEYLSGSKKNTDLGKLIRKKLDGKASTAEELQLKKLAMEVITSSMDARADKILAEWKESGITDKCSSIKGVGTAEEVIEENLRKFIWNDTLAAINIIQMTVTDIAYYKDAEDLQKRFAQIHSPGVRANRYAKWNGEEVSDGYVRTVYLTDFEKVVSNVIENISIVFDNKIKAAKETAKAEGRDPENDSEVKSLEALKESLVGENGLYRQINVTDAQGYSSATSYRKKAIMFGKWSEASEATYNKLMKGDFTATDLQVTFQPLKPFVYTQVPKSSEVAGSPMTNLKVPIQNKNSEYLLVLADAILQEQNTGKPNLLRVINEVMEDSAKRNHRAGIDTVQFTSAVKSGLMGEIDITGAETEEEAREILEKAIYEGATTSEPYSTNRVHKIPVEDYCIQQEVPAHFRDHEQAHGSQTRAIVIADLLDFYPNGEEVMYTYKDGSVERSVNRKDFIREYEETIAENIQDSINRLAEELHIDVGTDRKSRNLALSKILQREILSNPSRYGTDLLIACSVNEDGEFRIPLGDPIQSKRVEQLINSIIKNRINKQTLPGGPVVQVSNFGTSRQLSIVFNDKDGEPLRKRKKGESDAEYKKYIEENQAGIAYLECFAPAYTRDLFSKFIDEDGNLDVEAIEATDPDLLKMIGYRIPTEDKYSISPLKIVGFLPREAGDGIMLPYDITLLNGSDFDIDKMYIMFKDLKVRKKKFNKKDEKSALFRGVQSSVYQALLDSRGKKGYNEEEVTEDAKKIAAVFLNKKIKIEDKRKIITEIESKYAKPEKWGTKIKDLYKAASRGYRSSRYESVQPTNDRALRNNKIVDMTYAVMTHETTVDKMLNPGGFDQQKAMGYKVAAFNIIAKDITDEQELLTIWDSLSEKSIDELKELASKDKNLCFIDTHIQFYDQNNAAGALIGIFAVHKVAHAFLGNDGFIYKGEFAPFTIAGNTISSGIPIDPEKDFRGQYVGKVLGSLVASAADAVKDPILNLMNINSDTAITLCTMVRLGIPFDTAAMFLSQKVVGDILREKANKNIDGYTSLGEIIKKRLADLDKTYNITSDSTINTEELTMEELIVGIKGGNPAIEYKVLSILSTIMNINNDMRGLSYLTRFNSISNAVGPLIIDNLLMEEKLANFPDTIYSQEGVKLNAIDVLRRHPILNKFHETISIAHHLFGEMPTNSDNFRDILRSIPGSLRDVVMRDRKLLSNISDFYQSYMLINSGAIDYSKLSYYINEFPKEYIKIISENPELKNNALIQAIRLAVDDKSGKPILKIDTTGIERDYKESLSSGWADLVKTNKELAIQLFHYNFFKGGIVFNPKTFMGLAPNKVKENIDGYVETYRNSPALDPVHFLDLFIRNNWSEYKLVPRLDISLKTSDIKSGKVSFTKIEDIEAIGDKRYFRVKLGKSDLLLRISYVSDSEIKADVISPLGNNKEYLEMSTKEITKAMVETKEAIDDDSPSTIDDTRKESSEGVYEEGFIVTKDTKYTMEEYMELLVGKDKVSIGLQKIENLSTKEFFSTTASKLAEISKARGVEVSIESIAKIFNKMC